MDCAEIRQEFVGGGIPSGEAARAHLESCSHCAELFHNGALLGQRLALTASSAPADLNEPLRATEALLGREQGLRAFLRSRSTRMRWLLSLSLPALLLVRELMRGRVAWRQLGVPRVLAGLLLAGLLGLVAHSALRPLPIAVRAARVRSVLAVLAWGLPCVLWFAPDTRGSADELSGGFALRSLSCFAYGSALAAPSFALLWVLDRGEVVSYRVWALAAATVALVANLILLLHCSSTNRSHLMAGHFSIGLVWFLAATGAAWWARRVG